MVSLIDTPHISFFIVLVQIRRLSLKGSVFGEQGDQAPIKMGGPGNPASQRTSKFSKFPQKFRIQKSFKAAEMVQPRRLLQPGTQISIAFLYCTETGQQIMQLALQGLDYYPKFPRVLKIPAPPDNRKLSREHNAHVPKWWSR